MTTTKPVIPLNLKSDAERDAWARGWNHGHGIACCNVPAIGDKIDRSVDWVGLGKAVDADNIREYHQCLCYAAEGNSRQYSPFEFTAHDFNEAGEGDENTPSSEELWDAFEQGTNAAIEADLATYTDEDYGITAI